MMQERIDFLLIGGGLASAQAAETLRREGATGSIRILSDESILPYHRPDLSKRYLLGTADQARILIHPASFYREHHIDVMLATRVAAVDTAERYVTTSAGKKIQYDKMLIATGAIPRSLDMPGLSLKGVHTLRFSADCDAIRNAIVEKAGKGKGKGATPAARRVVVAGGSFQGMEVAMSLLELGLDVTIVEATGNVLPHLEAPVLSAFFKRHAQESGATVVVDDAVVSITGQGKVQEVQTQQGKRLPCDLVIFCAGVEPATGFLQNSGIALEQGRVLVDDRMETNIPGVFAAGDAANFFDPLFARRRHIEHWDNAVKQGRLAALNMLGRRLRYDEVSYFFCEIGNLGFDMLGDPTGIDETVSRGSLKDKSFSLFYLKDDVPHSVFTLGRPVDETRIAEEMIRYRTRLKSEKSKLPDINFVLPARPAQNVLILQGGGALGAFECGVVKAMEEHRIYPDIVAGISIGALNGAIIASHPKDATAALESFWSELQVPSLQAPTEPMRRAATAMQILQFGVEKFFRPRWIPTFDQPWVAAPWTWTSFYDTSPMKQLLAKYVDFPALKSSPVRLMVGAVNVLTAEFEAFDSYVDDLTPDHILASGSLPPGFSWTYVNGKPYWDGAVVSNSPLDMVVDRCGADGKRVFVVDLFASHKSLPSGMAEIMARRDEIVYSERVRGDLRAQELIDAYRGMIEELMQEVTPERRDQIKRLPRYIQLVGNGARTQIIRFVRQGPADEPSSRDYDFSDVAVMANMTQGYDLAKSILAASTLHGRRPPARRNGGSANS